MIKQNIKPLLHIAILRASNKVLAVKLKLTKTQREIFRKIGRAGGLAGDRKKKQVSAFARWARVKAERNARADEREWRRVERDIAKVK